MGFLGPKQYFYGILGEFLFRGFVRVQSIYPHLVAWRRRAILFDFPVFVFLPATTRKPIFCGDQILCNRPAVCTDRMLVLVLQLAIDSCTGSCFLSSSKPILGARRWSRSSAIAQRRILLPSGSGQAYLSATVGLLAIVLSMFVSTGWDFPAPGALTAVLGALSFISGVADDRITHPVKRFFSRSFLVYVGSISYSLYLWHWPVIVLFKWTCGIESALTISLAILVAILLAVFSYHAIEKPFLATTALKHSTLDFGFSIGSSTQRMHRFSRSFSFGVVVLVVGICSIAGANRLYHRISKSMTLSLSVTEYDPFVTGPWHHFDRDFPTKSWHNRKLFIIGDSHAGSYGALAGLLRKETGLDAIVHSEGGVEFASLMRPPGKRDLDFGSRVLDDLKKRSRPGDAVLLSSLRVERFCDQWKLNVIADVIAKRDSAEAESQRRLGVESGIELITQLQALGLEVVIECPKPILLSPLFRCSDWFNSMNPIGARGFTVERDFLLEHRAPAMKSIHEVASRLPTVRIWDPMDVLCPGEIFNGFDGSKPNFLTEIILAPTAIKSSFSI